MAIDVSEYQGNIDWQKVYQHGVRRAYIKCTEGRTLSDSKCKRNVEAAREVGIQIGLYHYAHPNNSVMSEWKNFVANASGLIHAGDLPPALDLEVTEGHDWKFLNDWKAQWLHNADDLIGVDHGAVFYSYFYFLKQMVLWPDRPVWGAATGSNFTPPHEWNIWQHSFHGTVPGINGYVDLDRFLQPIKTVVSGL